MIDDATSQSCANDTVIHGADFPAAGRLQCGQRFRIQHTRWWQRLLLLKLHDGRPSVW